MKYLTRLVAVVFLLLSFNVKAENYIYGGPKVVYYDVEEDDLQDVANDLVALGFSTAKVEANTSGLGLDIGLGTSLSEALDIEAGFAYLGEFKLSATMTGPAETLDITSNVYSFPIGLKFKMGDSDANAYFKGALHRWNQMTDIETSLGTVNMWGTGWDPMFGIGAQLGELVFSYEHYSFSGVGAGAGIGAGGISAASIIWKKEF